MTARFRKDWRNGCLNGSDSFLYINTLQDSVTGRAEIKFKGARKVYLCEFERGTGAREIYSSEDQTNTQIEFISDLSRILKGYLGLSWNYHRWLV